MGQNIGGGSGGGGGGSVPRGFIKDFTKPVLGDFTAVNQNDTVVTSETYGVVVEDATGTAPDLSVWVKSAPATPYSVTGFISLTPQYGGTGQYDAFLCFRESATGKIILVGMRWDPALTDNGRLQVDKYTNPTTFSANAFQDTDSAVAIPMSGFWVRIRDNGTTIFFDASADGARWISVFSEARGTFFTTAPDQVGFGIVTRIESATFFHWEEG